ncbi:MAG: hypothetical protein ACJ0J5_05595 [Dehalococcoidia bacterium]|nr:hypothetical protein [Chloroflexota bacterium]RZP12852.1 MAG: hypothetical protein EVA32_06285 [Chloroflexota bacterium]|tara:strand:+ start:3273 stop:3485 length:213 start_codon:yes stop_codon:yes gene_type:complete
MSEKLENLDNLTVTELSELAEKLHEEIMTLYEKEDTEDVFSQIEEKTRYFNEVKTIIRDLHSDERYPRGG